MSQDGAIPASRVTVTDKSAALLEAYKKHAAELLALEASYERSIALILGIYAAGSTLVAGVVEKVTLTPDLRWTLTGVALFVLVFGIYFAVARNRARRGIRAIIVDIEAALDFYAMNSYLAGRTLYSGATYHGFPKSSFLERGWWILVPACVGFIAVVFLVQRNVG